MASAPIDFHGAAWRGRIDITQAMASSGRVVWPSAMLALAGCNAQARTAHARGL